MLWEKEERADEYLLIELNNVPMILKSTKTGKYPILTGSQTKAYTFLFKKDILNFGLMLYGNIMEK